MSLNLLFVSGSNKSFGAWVRELRESHHPPMTQSEYAEMLGVDQTLISKIELDRIEQPSKGFCFALAFVEGLPFELVFERAGLPPMKRFWDTNDQTTNEDEAMLKRALARFKTPEARARAISATLAMLNALAEYENKANPDMSGVGQGKQRKQRP